MYILVIPANIWFNLYKRTQVKCLKGFMYYINMSNGQPTIK